MKERGKEGKRERGNEGKRERRRKNLGKRRHESYILDSEPCCNHYGT